MPGLTPGLTSTTLAGSMAILVMLAAPSIAQSRAQSTDTSRGLSMQFADGRIQTRPLRPAGGMWTAGFPRIAGVDTSRDGVLLTTLDVRYVVEGSDVVVTVSLFYGGPYKNGVTVATVRVTPDKPVRLDELRVYGVEPITFSLAPIPEGAAYAPEGVSVSGQIGLRAEPIGPNVSAYRLVLTNRSPLALIWFQFKGYRGDRLTITGRPRGKRNLPLVPPNAEHVQEVTLAGAAKGGGPEAWEPIDRFEISSLMWEDGLVEGDPVPAAQQRRFEESRAFQIDRLLTLLRGAGEHSIVSLRSAIGKTMTFDPETRQARDSVLADLEALERTQRSRDGQDFGTWLTSTIAEYQQWRARIVIPIS